MSPFRRTLFRLSSSRHILEDKGGMEVRPLEALYPPRHPERTWRILPFTLTNSILNTWRGTSPKLPRPCHPRANSHARLTFVSRYPDSTNHAFIYGLNLRMFSCLFPVRRWSSVGWRDHETSKASSSSGRPGTSTFWWNFEVRGSRVTLLKRPWTRNSNLFYQLVREMQTKRTNIALPFPYERKWAQKVLFVDSMNELFVGSSNARVTHSFFLLFHFDHVARM